MNKNLYRELDGRNAMISGNKSKEVIKNFFTKDVEAYINTIKQLNKDMRNKFISENDASKLFISYSNLLMKKANDLENKVREKIIIKSMKEVFRTQVGNIINKSFLMSRGYNKPYGYPGDYKLIEMFYENIALSKGIGYCGDTYILQDSYVEAVRIRKNMMKKTLEQFIKKSDSNSLNIMNIGCGSCKELRELLAEYTIDSNKEVIFTLLDREEKALEFAKQSLIKYQNNGKIQFNFIKENVVNIYKKHEIYSKLLNKQDLIYCIGLADYIPDIIFGEMLKFSLKSLSRKGILTVAHKNIKVHKSIASDWFCNWYFYPRSKEDVEKIVYEYLGRYKYTMKINEDKTKHIYFVTLSRDIKK